MSPSVPDPYRLPADLPMPQDDGAAAHLPGLRVPALDLIGDDGHMHDFSVLCRHKTVVYAYPATGVPGADPIPDWDAIPGAPGCTVEALAFRRHACRFKAVGYEVVGLSAQGTAEQREFKQRVDLPFLLLSDPLLTLHQRLGLPIFTAHGRTFFKRLVFVANGGEVRQVLYPVFPPDEAAAMVLKMIAAPR